MKELIKVYKPYIYFYIYFFYNILYLDALYLGFLQMYKWSLFRSQWAEKFIVLS